MTPQEEAMLQGMKVRIAYYEAKIKELYSENAALRKQWNDLDQRNEKRHRAWSKENDQLKEQLETAREELTQGPRF